ncbi:hypothetical protein TNCV_3710811 [Trichonephila clavipes]|uniref:Uncharacterized protein n=1 Tax=Trichonephila clavipes TaxID=2585209 RepID=A0A8X6RCJ7_TRICX|nr:hypothetical protein TNCV_3710811 [Trichonephila clavipes]
MATHMAKGCHGRTAGLSLGRGSILEATEYLQSRHADITPNGIVVEWVSVEVHVNGHRDARCLSARPLKMVWEDTGARSKADACVWTVANEVIGSARVCCMISRSSRRLVCQRRLEPGRRVNDTHLFCTLAPTPPHSQIRTTTYDELLTELTTQLPSSR